MRTKSERVVSKSGVSATILPLPARKMHHFAGYCPFS
jgi:hypothetical protein